MTPVAHLCWSSVWAGIAAAAVDRAQLFIRKAARGAGGQMPPGAAHFTAAKMSLTKLRAIITTTLDTYATHEHDERALSSLDFQSSINLLKVEASELAVQTVMSAMRACGLSGYRNDGDFSVGRHLRDVLSSPLMINNDRILTNIATASLMSGVPATCAIEPDNNSTTRKPDHERRRPNHLARDRAAAGRSARSSRRRAVPQDGHRRRLRPHRALRGHGRAARRPDHASSRARHRSDALSAGDEPRPAGEIRLSEELPEPARLRLRPSWHRTRDQCRRQPLRRGRRLDHVAVAGRSRAFAGGLLSGLSDCGEPWPAARGRPALRCRRRLLPPRALAPSRPAAVVPDARICLHRQPGRRRRLPRALDGARPGASRATSALPSRSTMPAILSSAASAR